MTTSIFECGQTINIESHAIGIATGHLWGQLDSPGPAMATGSILTIRGPLLQLLQRLQCALILMGWELQPGMSFNHFSYT